MTAALVSEAIAQHTEGTYRPSQQNHDGHGCCTDPERFGASARARGYGARSLLGVRDGDGATLPVALVMTLRCRSWRCGCCAQRLRRKARARAFMGASGQKVAMLTLTIDRTDPRYGDPKNRAGKSRPRSSVMLANPRAAVVEESTRYASWAWNRFRTYLVREYGPLPYFRGLELQQSGVAHLHVLVRVKDATAFMALQHFIRTSGLVERAGFGPVVDFQLARSGGDVARYVTKADGGGGVRHVSTEVVKGAARPGHHASAYVTKLPDALPRYTRRTAWSLPNGQAPWAPGWVRPTPIAGFTWRVSNASESTIRTALELSDFHVADPGAYRVVAGTRPAERLVVQ